MHVAAWESIFTTDFISADENESLKIANIDGLIGQVWNKSKSCLIVFFWEDFSWMQN